jgi:hypothetical protein
VATTVTLVVGPIDGTPAVMSTPPALAWSETVAVASASKAPRSHRAPLGREIPRWSVAKRHGVFAASIARLPLPSSTVSVGPPLSASGWRFSCKTLREVPGQSLFARAFGRPPVITSRVGGNGQIRRGCRQLPPEKTVSWRYRSFAQ